MKEFTYDWDYTKDEPILKISKSSMGSFNWCPIKYQFSYIEGRKTDQTEAMLKGSIVHNNREEWFNSVDIAKAETMSEQELKIYFMSLYPIDDYSDIYSVMASNSASLFLNAKIDVNISGAEVPIDTIVIPTARSFTPILIAIPIAPLTNKSDPK